MQQHRVLLAVLMCVCIALCFLPTVRSLVFGLDFGSRWTKMAAIRNNAFEVILDAQTKRKFGSVVAFYDDERYFAGEAEKVLPRSPQTTYFSLGQLLGKYYNSSTVQELKPYAPFFDSIVANDPRGTVALRYDENSTFPVEDLVGMIFTFARETAEHYMHTPVVDVVITVPPYWTVEERSALIEAASLGGFNVISLVNDGTAVGLHYAFGKRFEEPRTVIFYDMGHSNTRATLAEYSSVLIKNNGKNTTQSTMKVKAVAYDKLGGRDFDLRLAELLAGVAVQQLSAKGVSTSIEEIKENKKAWSRLLTAANQAKTVLSANTETFAAVEGLVGDYDLKTTVTRTQFEDACRDFFTRAALPLLSVLNGSETTIEEVHSVEIVGGSVRIPKLQATLKEALGIANLSKTLNGDEAAVLGSVFYAAQLSSTVKGSSPYKVKDVSPYSISARLKINQAEDHIDEEDQEKLDSYEKASHIKRDDDNDDDDDDDEKDNDDHHELKDENGAVIKLLELFKPFSRVGAKKTVSFRKKANNFTVTLAYGEENNLPSDVSRQLIHYDFEDLSKISKYNYTGKPKFSLVFRLSTSGLVELEKAEAEVVVIKYPEPEPSVTATPSPSLENESVPVEEITELGDQNSNDTESQQDSSSDTQEDIHEQDKEDTRENEDTDEEDELTKKEKKKEEKGKKKLRKEEEKKAKKARKPKKTVHKVTLTPVTHKLGIPLRSTQEKARARALLKQWEARAAAKKAKAEAKNDLEAYIYDVKEKLYDEELEKVSTQEQRDEALDALSAAAEWLEGEGVDMPHASDYRKKKDALVQLVFPIFERKEELTKRPVQVAMLSYMLNHSRFAVENITEYLMVEPDERDDLLDLIDEAEEWLTMKVKEQEQKMPHEELAFRSEQVQSRYTEIDKMLRKLLRRKPRATPTPAVVELNDTAIPDPEEAQDFESASDSSEETVPTGEKNEEEDIL